jgi:HAD superfamily hydrolase (TIGR01509 family)
MVGNLTEEEHFITVLNNLGKPDFGIREFQEAFWGGDDIDKELISFIASLKNKFKLGLLSNAMDDTRLWLSEKYDLLKLFDVSIFSGEVKMAKPGYEIYRLILNQLNVDAEDAIFIDDFIENIEAADHLGFTTIHYHSTAQTIKTIHELTGIL